MKKFLSVLILCLLPCFAFAGEQEVIDALENIRKQLDAGVEEPVNETLDRLVSEAKTAIDANEAEYARWRRVRKETGYLLVVARRQ